MQNRVKKLARGVKKYLRLVEIWIAGGKAKLKVSFSGGKTSALMAKRIKDALSNLFELVFVFCNTADEDEKTLIFVDRCDEEFELDLTMLEAVVHPEYGTASTHRIVTFETASRKQEPFIEVVKVYGISNVDFEPCNRELKLNPMKSYMREIGWEEGEYYTAIGIRKDEPKRLSDTAIAGGILYLMADLWPTDSEDVGIYWEDMPFELGLEEHQGNCKTCWKKNLDKLFMVYAEEPDAFAWRHEMEIKYGWHGAPYYGVPTEGGKPRVWFRGNLSTADVIAQAKAAGIKPGIKIKERRSHAARQFTMDFDTGGCTSSCEPFTEDDDDEENVGVCAFDVKQEERRKQ